jgi:hypothetical protein
LDKERIPDQEDREFTTTTGRWTGDIAWDDTDIQGNINHAVLTKPDGSTQGMASLAFPNVSPVVSYKYYLYIECATKLFVPCPDSITIELTDGVYSFSAEFGPFIMRSIWQGVQFLFNLPQDFDIESAVFNLIVDGPEAGDQFVYIDNASLLMVSRVDHLPILGVG